MSTEDELPTAGEVFDTLGHTGGPAWQNLVANPVADQGSAAADSEPDMVNHPPHYNNHPSGVECIDITREMSCCPGNAVKYVWRHKLKGTPRQDLEKALFYLDDVLSHPDSPQDITTRGSTLLMKVAAYEANWRIGAFYRAMACGNHKTARICVRALLREVTQ